MLGPLLNAPVNTSPIMIFVALILAYFVGQYGYECGIGLVLLISGKSAEARVLSSAGQYKSSHRITYRFDVNGIPWRRSQRVSGALYDDLVKAGTARIRYFPSWRSVSRLSIYIYLSQGEDSGYITVNTYIAWAAMAVLQPLLILGIVVCALSALTVSIRLMHRKYQRWREKARV